MNFPACTLHRPTLLIAFICGLITSASAEWNEKVLYSFRGGTDGAGPSGGLVRDKAGNLYGATSGGGSSSCYEGCGTVFELSPPNAKGGSWTETVLYAFTGHAYGDGASPGGSVIMDEAGNLYGATGYGGTGPCLVLGVATGCGTVYELSPPAKAGDPWTEKVLYSFQGGDDGDLAHDSLVFDREGNLYGATWFGGGKGTTCNAFFGGTCGTIFELRPPQTEGGQWTENVLHRFGGGEDGAVPNGGLILDSEGSLYGTTGNGGAGCPTVGCGTVFRLIPKQHGESWTEKILLKFNGQDGYEPLAGVIPDKRGNLYGTFYSGGKVGDGGVFELARPNQQNTSWSEKVLYSFQNDYTGASPLAGLLLDKSGNLYGTNIGCAPGGCAGVVFKLTMLADAASAWVDTTLYVFPGPPTQNGFWPEASLLPDGRGHLYTTTVEGGTGQNCAGGCGAVVEVWP
jgi:uncharacterized repeat protein (TIGR03803 family)